jgi:serine/threonine protein kinase
LDEDETPTGTLQYMSPEQMEYGTTNEASDVYSFGMTIYEVRNNYYLPLKSLRTTCNHLRYSPVTLPSEISIVASGHRCVAMWRNSPTDQLNPNRKPISTEGLMIIYGASLRIVGARNHPTGRRQ